MVMKHIIRKIKSNTLKLVSTLVKFECKTDPCIMPWDWILWVSVVKNIIALSMLSMAMQHIKQFDQHNILVGAG